MEYVFGVDIFNSYVGLVCVEEFNDMIIESLLDVVEEEIIDDDDDDIIFIVEVFCYDGDEIIEIIEVVEVFFNMDFFGFMLDEKWINNNIFSLFEDDMVVVLVIYVFVILDGIFEVMEI